MTSNFLDVIPGISDIEKMLKAFDKVAGWLPGLLDTISIEGLPHIITETVKYMDHLGGIVGGDLDKGYDALTQFGASPFISGLLQAGFGIDATKFDDNANNGIKVLDHLMTFTLFMSYASMAGNLIGKLPLANRFPEGLFEPIAKLPEELGLSWAIGTFLETVIESAIGTSLEEGIAEQKRPNRIGFQQLRLMLRQHLLSEADATKWFEKLGFPDDQIALLKQLADAQLPIGDLQQLYLYGIMSESQVQDYISALGFSERDAKQLKTLYIDKAQTQAGSLYRTTARDLFERDLIAESQYRSILKHVNTPDKEVDDDLAAIQLAKDNGKLTTAVGTIKALYQHGEMSAEQMHKELAALSYSDTAITDLQSSWDLPATAKPHGLTQAKILSYYVSGILNESDARNQLTNTNLRGATIDFLLAHPTAATGVKVRKLSPSLVIEAYLAGALTEGQLPDAFKKASVPDDQMAYYINIAQYRYAHRKHTSGGTKALSEGQIIDAWYLGIIHQDTALADLQKIGYSDADAITLLEIKNKGIFQQAPPPLFSDLFSAIEFMTTHGYSVTPPPDPRFAAAEAMLAAAGYSWTPTVGGPH